LILSLLTKSYLELILCLLLLHDPLVDEVAEDAEGHLEYRVAQLHEQVRAVVAHRGVCYLILGDLHDDIELNDDEEQGGDTPQSLVNGQPYFSLLEQLAGHLDEEVHHEEEDKRAATLFEGLQEYPCNFRGKRVMKENH